MVRTKKPPSGHPMKHKKQLTFRKKLDNPVFKKLALAFVIVIIATATYLQYLAPHTLEAKQRVELESTQSQLIETKRTLQDQKTLDAKEDAEKQQKLDEVQKQLEETQRQLQAKRSTPQSTVAYAAEAPAPVVRASGSCEQWMSEAGIPITSATRQLIINESGCRPDAVNPSSGACGIPQALPCSKLPCTLQDPVCQLKWMDRYVKERYTTWEGALSFWHCIGTCYNNYGATVKTATWY